MSVKYNINFNVIVVGTGSGELFAAAYLEKSEKNFSAGNAQFA